MRKLNEREWKDVELGQIADISSGRDIYAQERISGDTPYITSGTANNGIGYFVGNDNGSKARNAISVNRNGAVGEAFYHPYNALYGNDCRRVNMKDVDDADTQLFTAECISEQKKAFSYSRKLGTARLRRLHVMLPVDDDGKPDYGYMAQYASEMRGVCSCGIRIMLQGSSPSWNTRTFRHWTRRSGKSFGLVSYLKSAVQKPETRTITTWGTYRLLRQEQ